MHHFETVLGACLVLAHDAVAREQALTASEAAAASAAPTVTTHRQQLLSKPIRPRVATAPPPRPRRPPRRRARRARRGRGGGRARVGRRGGRRPARLQEWGRGRRARVDGGPRAGAPAAALADAGRGAAARVGRVCDDIAEKAAQSGGKRTAGQLLLMYNVLQFERHCGGAAPGEGARAAPRPGAKLLVRQLSSAEQSSQRQRFHDNRAQLRAKQGSAPRPAAGFYEIEGTTPARATRESGVAGLSARRARAPPSRPRPSNAGGVFRARPRARPLREGGPNRASAELWLDRRRGGRAALSLYGRRKS